MGPLEVIGAAETLATLALAILLFAYGGRRPSTLVLGTNFVAFSVILLSLTGPAMLNMGLTPIAELAVALARIVLWTSLLAFAVLFPSWSLTPRKAWLLAVAVVPGFLLVWTVLTNPAAMLTPQGGPSALLKDLVLGLRDVALVASLLVFGRHYLRAEPGPYRRQFLFVLLPYLLYALNDGAGDILATFRGTTTTHPVLFALTLSSIAITVGLAILALRRAVHEGRAAWEDRVVALWVVAALPLALVQFMGGTLGENALFLHFLVDGLAAFVLFYGVARHHILDIDIKLKIGMRRGVIAGFALVVVIIVEVLLQNWVGRVYGVLAGAVVAGLGLFVLTPIHRMAERLSEKAFPNAVAGNTYIDYKRLELYRVALEGMLRDGVDVARASALTGLRRKLRISDEEHHAIEREVRDDIHERPLDGASPA